MDDTFQQFRAKLDELFQMDRAELDFGIYRIMNTKRGEISRYLEEDLYPQVEEILAEAASDDAKAIEDELEKKIAQAKELGVDPESLDAVKELRARLTATTSPEELRQRTFSHLLTFFSRYYDKGDFISKRRYKDGTYMIPYNGEEVKLVWANMDQYYIKTSEYLRDYRFFLNAEKTLRMTFKLVEGDTERDNIKGKNRIFQLRSEEPVTVTDEGLVAYFEYLLSDSNQKDANSRAYATILERADRYRPYLEQKDEKSGKTLLEKHLAGYTARNSEDYFIHKDLKGFLERELDFFLKNEVLRIDDLIGNDGEGIQAELHLARAIKQVGGKIIAMLAQIEEFQKKLWLKRKMVTSTNYLVTLDKIIEKVPELLPQIAANDEQREEWVLLFAIDEITEDSGSLPGMGGVAYSEPLTEEFLRANDKLVVDTRFFDRDFVATLLAGFDDIDEETDGLLVHSENFQALNLLQERYREKVKCIYIDPPYNTGEDGFNFKDGYQSSSWLSMLSNSLSVSRESLRSDGVIFSSIDDGEYKNLWQAMGTAFGEANYLGSFVWKRRSSSGLAATPLSLDHEYVLAFAKDASLSRLTGLAKSEDKYPFFDEKSGKRFASTDLTIGATREQRPNQYYSITNPRTGVVYEANPNRVWRFFPETMGEIIKRDLVIWPDESDANMSRPRYKTFYDPYQVDTKPCSSWIESSSVNDRELEEEETEYETAILKSGMNQEGGRVVQSQFGSKAFAYPKPVSLVRGLARSALSDDSAVIDFFAGSGTTGHAVINLNREDSGSRKYILVEMGEYFDTVLKPRIAKVIYSTDWKDGKP
jgi:adenine-specific DNA-methyltransferase